jgi:hypothetical protein
MPVINATFIILRKITQLRQMIIVFTPLITDRLSYILDEVFTHRLGVTWIVTDNPAVYRASEKKIKINYSSADLEGIKVPVSGFLEDTGISAVFKPEKGQVNYEMILFPIDAGIGYDVFAMAFWCLSRYEEYQSFIPDEHLRFCASQSLFFDNDFIELPVLDIALENFYKIIGVFSPDKFAVFPTLDIDIAFKHKGKGIKRGVLSFFKLLIYFRINDIIERIAVNIFGKKDPWDSFDYILEKLEPYLNRTRFFIHAGPQSKYDKPVPIHDKGYIEALKRINSKCLVGVHPSYFGGLTAGTIKQEKEILESALGLPINRSRQHFLKMSLPKTYQALLVADITHDYSMGFPDRIGFRAGTGQSFRFYDLTEERATSLVIHPFCVMDVTLKNYMALSVEKAKTKTAFLMEICKKYQTPFCFIYHNESLSDDKEWAGWKEVFESWLK